MLVKLTFHTTRPVINRASTICSAFICSAFLVLLELAQDGEKQLHTISSYFPKAITTGISHRTSIDIISSVLVKHVLAQLGLFWSLVLLRFEGETNIFLADVIVKTWNPEDVGPTTTRLEGQQITGLPWKSTRLQSSSDTWVSLCSLHTRHRLTPTQSSSPWEHIRSLTTPPHQPSITWRLKARSCYVNIK